MNSAAFLVAGSITLVASWIFGRDNPGAGFLLALGGLVFFIIAVVS